MDLSSPVTWARRRPRSLTKIIDYLFIYLLYCVKIVCIYLLYVFIVCIYCCIIIVYYIFCTVVIIYNYHYKNFYSVSSH